MKVFKGWQERIKAAHLSRNEKVLKFDPENGPPNDIWTNPADRAAFLDLWDVCLWTRDRVKELLKDEFSRSGAILVDLPSGGKPRAFKGPAAD